MRALALLPIVVAFPVLAQVPADSGTSQVRKEWVLGHQLADDLDKRDGKFADPAVVEYVQRIENRIAGAAINPSEIRVTRAFEQYAALLPQGVLYISAGLLNRVENEAELAGLLAHELGHVARGAMITRPAQGISFVTPACALSSPQRPLTLANEIHAAEQSASRDAVQFLRLAGYDPFAALDLLSKLSYEHPAWSKAIDPDDLLNIRAAQPEIVPAGGYRIDSSDFLRAHETIARSLKDGQRPAHRPSLNR